MKQFFVLLIFFLSSVICLAQDQEYKPSSSQDYLSSQLKAMASRLETLQSEFTQKKHISSIGATVESKGKFWYVKPRKMRWEYTEPYQYIIKVTNGKVVVDDGGLNSNYKKKGSEVFQQMNKIISACMNGSIINDDRFTVLLEENSTMYRTKLIPDDEQIKQLFPEIFIYIDKTSFSIISIQINEKAGDYTLIDFANRIVNKAIPADKFSDE